MSSLVDFQISAWGRSGGIEPFRSDLVNPASYNLTIGDVAEVESPNGTLYRVDISECTQSNPFLVDPGEFLLTATGETITLPPNMEGEIVLRSSAARAGWNHHFAGYCDPGYVGNPTLEFINNRRFAALPIYPGLQLVQMRLRRLDSEPLRHYGVTGRYHGDRMVNGCQDPTLGVSHG